DKKTKKKNTVDKKAGTDKRGRLKIGDEWNAIVIIANSQTSPLKAVSELVENSIDAGAGNIHILRALKAGGIYLKVMDDGKGIKLDPGGVPDFRYVATHICDSMKRRLAQAEKGNVHGEFGIGLLGFWSIGDELRLVTRGESGSVYEMVLRKGVRTFTQRRIRGKLAFAGAEVTVLGLNETNRKLLTGEKISRYLASDLRDRIRTLNLNITIEDRVSRRRLRVQPREFAGEPILSLQEEPVEGYGPLKVELYLVFRAEPAGTRVSVYRDGTRVLENLCDLDVFDRAPLNSGRLEGVLDFKALNLAPGTRSGIVPDDAFAAFTNAVERIETPLLDIIADREQAEEENLSRGILKSIWKAVSHALEDLSNEYLLFDVGRSRGAAANKDAVEQESGFDEAVKLPSTADSLEYEDAPPVPEPGLFDPLAGPMARLELKPSGILMPPGATRRMRAVALDEVGQPVRAGVVFRFDLEAARCVRIARVEGDLIVLKASGEEGETRMTCTAVEGRMVLTARAVIRVSEDANLEQSGRGSRHKGLPSFRYSNKPDEAWRSRFDLDKNVILINSGHRDFATARTKPATLKRYLGKLYAKEVVYLNFPDLSSQEAMERLIELITRMESKL
ncbi:MAG: ATP-binding protein, partial [Planctomycetes bacterium]|nr:ATP-binding protein [Planctomycetota bacterium]